MRSELRSSIHNDRQWNPMLPHNLINVESGIILISVSRVQMNKVVDLVILSTITHKEACCLLVL